MEVRDNTIEENEQRISVGQFLKNSSLLKISYTPTNMKFDIVGQIISEMIKGSDHLNTALLRRISTEAFITVITNIDLNQTDENGFNGYDQLMFHDKLDYLKSLIMQEYREFEMILNEYIKDYKHLEIVDTINRLYDMIVNYGTDGSGNE